MLVSCLIIVCVCFVFRPAVVEDATSEHFRQTLGAYHNPVEEVCSSDSDYDTDAEEEGFMM